MFNCAQCHASTPDECARRHAAQLELHRAIETQRAAMAQAVNEIADNLIRYAKQAASDLVVSLVAADIQRFVASSNLPIAAEGLYINAVKVSAMVREWKES